MTGRPRDLWPPLPEAPPLAAGDITDLDSVTLRGDIRSYAWDGGSDLSGGADPDATAGFFLDSSEGAAQFQNLISEGGTFTDVTITGVLTSSAGSSIDWTHVANVSVATADIEDAAITNAKIDTLAASKLTAGTINTGTINVASLLQMSSGGTFQTAASGSRRVRLRSTTTDRIEFVSTTNSVMASLILNSDNELFIDSNNSTARIILYDTQDPIHIGDPVSQTGSGLQINAGNLTLPGGGAISLTGGGRLQVTTSSAVPITAYNPTATSTADVQHWRSNNGGTNTLRALVKANGDFQSFTNSYGALSDRRLKVKRSIKPARSYLEDLRRIQIRKFRFKREKDVLLGPIAQEVQEVFPGLVTESFDGYLAVKSSVFVPMLITAVQELADRLEVVEGA